MERKNIGGLGYFQNLSPIVKRSLVINLLGPHSTLKLNILGNCSLLDWLWGWIFRERFCACVVGQHISFSIFLWLSVICWGFFLISGVTSDFCFLFFKGMAVGGQNGSLQSPLQPLKWLASWKFRYAYFRLCPDQWSPQLLSRETQASVLNVLREFRDPISKAEMPIQLLVT